MPNLVLPPLSTDSSDFSNRADNFHTDLTSFNEAVSQEATTIQQVQLGDAYYNAILPMYSSTSSTSNTIGYGNLNYTVDTGELLSVGVRIRAVSGNNWVSGVISAYNPSTGVLTLQVLAFSGSGTYSSWAIQPEFRRVPGALTTVASSATVDLRYAGDRAVTLTGTIGITAFTLVKGQVVHLITTGTVTLTHNSTTLSLPAAMDYTTNIGDILRVSALDGVISVNIYPKSGFLLRRNQRVIFGFGTIGAATHTNVTNLISSEGILLNDVTGVGSIRFKLAAASYGGDKAIFGYGHNGTTSISITNLVSNTGVMSADIAGVGTARNGPAAASYGGTKAIFGFGLVSHAVSLTNLVTDTGIVTADVTGVGNIRYAPVAAGYGGDKAIFAFGQDTMVPLVLSSSNLVANTGVVATDTATVGYPRMYAAGATYGGDKAILGYGIAGGATSGLNYVNLVSAAGTLAATSSGVGTARYALAAATYDSDKVIFGYGYTGTVYTTLTNLVSNTGVVATDNTGAGTARYYLAAAGFSQ